MRFIRTNAAPRRYSTDGLLVTPLLRLVYERCYIPGPAHLEAEQPADEFVYEMK